MKRITLSTTKTYDVIIQPGALSRIGSLLKEKYSSGKVCVIADSTAGSLYAKEVMHSLAEEGFTPCQILFPAGEHSKNLTTYANIVEAMASENLTRSDVVLALGGGVVSDLAGFAAGTYMRGIDLVQVPTTLLSAMDAAVGGKSAVNLLNGKNLAGVFWHPSLVICDTETFKNLPESQIQDALAEAVKSAVVSDSTLIPKILERDLEYILERCLSIKKSLVEVDEKDTSIRQLLGFGHTIGHGIEKLSAYSISHGKAVAKGMVAEARAAYMMGYTQTDISGELISILNKIGIDTNLACSAEDLYHFALMDKKIQNGFITMVIPESIGKCTLKKISLSELERFIEAACQ